MLNFLSSLKAYLIMGAIIVALIGGFFFYYKYSEAQKEVLIANNAKLQTAIDIQASTIDQLQKNAEKLATANINLSSQLSSAEQKSILENKTLQDAFNSEDPAILEQKANELFSTFNKSISNLTK